MCTGLAGGKRIFALLEPTPRCVPETITMRPKLAFSSTMLQTLQRCMELDHEGATQVRERNSRNNEDTKICLLCWSSVMSFDDDTLVGA